MQRKPLIPCLLAAFIGVFFSTASFATGNPTLLLGSGSNPFSSYPSEILRAEGLNAFDTADISSVNSTVLNAYDVVILGQVALTPTQVNVLTNWVNGGGRLIALRPDKQLAPLLGLTDAGSAITNGYLLVNTSSSPGAGIVGETIQFHGDADLYTLNGAAVVATLYSNASTPTPYPAVSIRSGVGNGIAAAFTYDLARSVVYTRQGNPAWAGQARVQQGGPIRGTDMFYGPASIDPQLDWVDLNKVAIPQADEQQRLLVNLILYLSQNKKPIPRFWYLPFGKKAAVVMTGDDHGNNGTAGRFDYFNSVSPTSCSVADWECVRATSYIYPSTPLSNTQAANYVAQGFEVGLHVNTGCTDYTSESIETTYASELADFAAAYPSVPAPVTNRTHCIAWSDWDSQALTSLAHGIRLDTNYYYWPPDWVQDRPGFFTGSGIPMRFAQQNGAAIDVYQATTQMTDESGQSFPLHIDSLLDGAIGPNGYYGVFTANMHTDSNTGNSQLWSEQIVASAQARGVPVVSAKQMLQWIDGRNASTFSNISWSGNTLTFSIAAANGSNGLQAMLPTVSPSGGLASLTVGGTPVSFVVQTIKGVDYAFFTAVTGVYSAVYSAPLPPVISSVTATPGINTAIITWTTDKPSSSRVDYDLSAGSLTSNVADSALVTSHTITINGLSQATAYYFRVTATTTDGGSTTSPTLSSAPGTFVTIDPNPPVISAVTATPGLDGTATITWTTNKLSNTRIDYGASPATLNLNLSNPALVTAHSITLSGLTFGATYYYRVTSVDSLNGSTTSPTPPSNPASFVNIPFLTLWNPAAAPVVLDGDDAGAVEVGVKFRSDFAGQVTGVRFYKAPTNTGTHIGSLWTNTGTLLASVTFTNESGSGWQQANFSTPVSIAANTTYVISCFMPVGHYSVSTGYFSSVGVDSPPLHALRDGVDGPNGLFRYASSATFPNQTWNSANYWVDAVVTMDNLPPVISAVSVSTTAAAATITWITSKGATSRVDYGTSPASLTQNVSSGSLVTAHSVTLTGLTAGTTYYYRVTSADGQGLTATSPAVVNSPANFVPADIAPPVISAVTVTPAAVSATISWTTDENATTRVDYGLAPGNLSFNASSPTLLSAHSIVLPGLVPATTYYYQVASVDAAGNTATSPVGTAASFLTVDNIPPVISSLSITPGVGGGATVTWTTSKLSNSRIDYGTAPDALTLNVTNNTQVTAHTVALTGLLPGTTYYLRVTSTDAANNSATTPVTADPPVTYLHTGRVTIWSSSAVPSVIDSGDSASVQLGLKFRSDTAGVVNGVRFYKADANTGTHVGSLWTSTGTLLSSVTFTNETASGWQQADFDTPIAITANTTYVVSYHAPNGRYSATSGLFSTAGVDNPPLHALATGVDGANAVFAYGPATLFPDQSFNSAGYWVDVVFSEDTLPPVINSVAATPTETGATITWTTNKLSNSRVDYGTSPSALSQNVSDAVMTTAHSLGITGLTTGTTYYFRVTSLDSQNASATAPAAPNPPLSFTTPDTTPPVISSVTTTPGATSATITWTTNESATSRVDYGTSPSNLNLNVSDSALITSHSITLASLVPGTTYYYSVTSTDAAANSASAPAGSPASFATIDLSPPVISSIVATPNLGGTATITWNTNKLASSRVDYGTAAANLSLNVLNSAQVTVHSIVLSNLVGGTTYYFRVTSADLLGNTATSPTTGNVPASFGQPTLQSIWSSSVTPTTLDAADAAAVELGLKFRTDTSGTVTGIRFYKAPANTGTHVGNLWSSTGALLGTASFTNETSSGWQQANFTSPIAITPDTTYIVSYYAPVGHYSVNGNYFTSGVDNGALHALANGLDGPNGVFKYGSASTFPDQSYNASNYWVDVVFAEPIAPVITAVTAVPSATAATITWKTNKLSSSRVDYGTSAANLNLSVTDSATVTAHSVNLIGLTTGVTYYYRVTSVDAQSNSTTSPALTSPAASFIPAAAPPSWSVWIPSATPAVVDSNDSTAIELGMKFRSDISGYVTGIRFYKAAANTGAHIGSLWSSTGVRLGTVTFANETASGWQQANLSAPVPIAANTTYVISYFAPNGRYSEDENFFSASGANTPPLHALQSGIDGPNGVYRYAPTGGFPDSTYNSTNYWVDLVFISDDAIPPTVTNFTLPATSSSLVVPITSFVATDNNAVAGYLVTESSTAPSPRDSGWTTTPPVSYGFVSSGSKTLYAWAKDGSQNVSASRSASVAITLTDTTAPNVTAFTTPTTAGSLTVPITSLTATDNTAVTGYLVNESATAPSPAAAGWSATVPASYTFTTSGIKTLYAWAKDAAGNVSTSRTSSVTITLSSDGPEPAGWYSGDIHVHRSCGGSPESVTSLLAKMGVNNLAAISLLADNGNGEVQNPVTDLPLVNGQDDPASTAGRIVHWDVEWHWDAVYTQYPHQALGGHLVALGLNSAQQIWDESTYSILNWARAQNGIAGFAHLQYLPSGIPDSLSCCTPIEYPVEVALGAADFISEDVDDSGSGISMNPDNFIQAYYKLLNTGFRPGFAAGTDYPCNSSRPLGALLTYAQPAAGQMTYRNWIEAIKNGRTVVSRNGHNEFLNVIVNGTATSGDQVDLASAGSVGVTVQWSTASNMSGTLELVSNGVVVASSPASASQGAPATWNTTINFPKSGWLAARRMGTDGHQVHTAAVFVIVNGAPIRASVDDAQFYVDWMDNLLTKTAPGGEWNSFYPTQLPLAQSRYQQAKALFQQRALEAAGGTATPTLTSITPASGLPGVTVPVTIVGTNLAGATLNLPAGITVSGTPGVTATQITASLVIASNATSGARSIAVTASGGTSNAVTFTVNSQPSPTLTGINPTSGARGASIPVTITGTNLLGATLNLPTGITASGSPTVTATQITATLVISSSATTGGRTITVTTSGGTSNSVAFTVASAPALTSITPSSGARGATVPVTIVGSNLLGTSLALPPGITLSGTPTITTTQITANLAISSSATTGAGSISVTNGGSTSNSVTFTVASAPSLTSISPSSGARGATIPVTIVGTNLLGTSLTMPSGITLSGTPTITATQITTNLVISSSATPGARSITVTTGGSTSNSVTFTVASAPTLASISPSSGFRGATVSVTIAGTNLLGTSLTLPSGITLSGTPTVTATQITASLVIASNATTGVRTITVTTGSSTSNSVNFTVNTPTPTLTAISPSSGALGATVPVSITGTNLTGATLNLPSGITLSGTPTVTATQITATLVISSSSATGARSISVTTTFGTSNSLTFTVTTAPVITSISPSAISRGGATTVTINGFNFTSTTTASVSPSTSITVGARTFVNSNQIRFAITVSSFAARGARSLTVTAGGQTSNAVTLTIQ